MHDTPLTAVATEQALPQIQPASASLAHQLVHLLQEVVEFATTQHDLPLAQRRPRGHPLHLSWLHLALALLMGVLQQDRHLSTIWRRLYLQPIGSFAPVHLTYEAVRKRLLGAGSAVLEQLFDTVSSALAQISQPLPSALTLAPFATEVVALDESTLDGLRRLTQEQRDLTTGDPHLLPGKVAALFDLRRQRWMRVQFRADVLAACNTGILLLLQDLAPGSLMVADLGYFSFPWFDYLSGAGYWWISRLKQGVTYEIKQVLAYDERTGLLDAIVWLGKYRADRAAHAVRLVCYTFDGKQHGYLTNVLDPLQLSVQDMAQIYARRWDIELAFKLLKCELGLHIWWGARPELVLVQLWIALILAQLLHVLQRHVALQAEVDPFDVSMPLLVEVLKLIPAGPAPIVEQLVQHGRALGLLRPSSRLKVQLPIIQPHLYHAPADLKNLVRRARYAQRNPHPRSAPFLSRFSTQLLI